MCSFWARRLSYLIPCILIKPSIIYSFTMFLWYPVLDLARAPCRAPLTARKMGSGYENGANDGNLVFISEDWN
jgi:hypothetical protein